jgi:hypothetical protein
MVSISASFNTLDKQHVTLKDDIPRSDLEGKTFREMHKLLLEQCSGSETYKADTLATIKRHLEEFDGYAYSLQSYAGYLSLDDQVEEYINGCECIGNCHEGEELRYQLFGPFEKLNLN